MHGTGMKAPIKQTVSTGSKGTKSALQLSRNGVKRMIVASTMRSYRVCWNADVKVLLERIAIAVSVVPPAPGSISQGAGYVTFLRGGTSMGWMGQFNHFNGERGPQPINNDPQAFQERLILSGSGMVVEVSKRVLPHLDIPAQHKHPPVPTGTHGHPLHRPGDTRP
ncbi:hypothetical protein B0H14DRAFT_2561362 [Mycena olivaceomarginata]|nr:hypothetical protein B0H14DRAFT_2561362 [Mycena olivaceomarginata]